eukprot:365542-Chlamydomonas_euryale.AAC.43
MDCKLTLSELGVGGGKGGGRGCGCGCVHASTCVRASSHAAQPPPAEWIRRNHPAHTPPRRLQSVGKEGGKRNVVLRYGAWY